MVDSVSFYYPEAPETSLNPQFDRSIDAVTYGPYPRNLYIEFEAFADGNNGDDDSWAYLELHLAGAVTRIEDRKFHEYHLRIQKSIVLTAYSTVTASIKTENGNGPTETGRGIRLLKWFWAN